MKRLTKEQHHLFSPWDVSLLDLDCNNPQETNSPQKIENNARSVSKSKSKSKSKIKLTRTEIKLSKINISSNENILTSLSNKHALRPTTPKEYRTCKTPKGNQSNSNFNSIINIETWRSESRRLLLSMANSKIRFQGRSKSSMESNRSPEKETRYSLLSKLIGQDPLKNSTLVYKKARPDYPNLTRFKLLQSQKRVKL